jgi:hypothetical protein
MRDSKVIRNSSNAVGYVIDLPCSELSSSCIDDPLPFLWFFTPCHDDLFHFFGSFPKFKQVSPMFQNGFTSPYMIKITYWMIVLLLHLKIEHV